MTIEQVNPCPGSCFQWVQETAGEQREVTERQGSPVSDRIAARSTVRPGRTATGGRQVHGERGGVQYRYRRQIADTGRTPTLHQFSRMAEDAANSWFGGDLERVYAAIGEKSPVDPVYERLMPSDVSGMATNIFEALGGQAIPRFTAQTLDEAEANREEIELAYQAAAAARGAIRLIQCREAKGEDPSLPEFGTGKWTGFSGLFGQDDDAWDRFTKIVDDTLAEPPTPKSTSPPIPPVPLMSRLATDSRSLPPPPVPNQLGAHKAKSKKGLLDRLLGR